MRLEDPCRYSHPVDKTTGVRSDHTVILTAIDSAKVYPEDLRRVSYLDVDTRKRFKFLSNNFTLPALTIAQIYKCRWQVDLFFESLDMVHSFGCHGISRINCAESSVGGVSGWFRSATHRSTSALRRIQGALTQACDAAARKEGGGFRYDDLAREAIQPANRRILGYLFELKPTHGFSCREPGSFLQLGDVRQ